ncbi:Protein Vhl [Lucilia cuprina]|uniref:Protein Vhl n=1 Tax=Lucilia cuprina TaxID=7375 RepID=A0A0L0CQ26_LUCCU|nr:Protein Vhl [Lucilia cuprina]KNC33539.1 Protein Vhl [Lucilia cuprina]
MAVEVSHPSADQPQQPLLAAQNSLEQTFVFFHNSTQRYVNLYWMDFNGRQDFFTMLKPGAGIKANTFVTHPWIFRDSQTGERMQVKHQDIFWPQLYRVRDPQNRCQWIPCRKLITIHQPVRSLRYTSLWNYAKQIYGNQRVVLEREDIPNILKRDLSNVLKLIEKHQAMGVRGR